MPKLFTARRPANVQQTYVWALGRHL